MPETSEKANDLRIYGAQEVDSKGKKNWRLYCKSQRLLSAWSPPIESPYLKYQKILTINEINSLTKIIKPRHSDVEGYYEGYVVNAMNLRMKDETIAVILDAGGPHSIAMAIKFARDYSYQPVVMFNDTLGSGGMTKQELATLVYYAREIEDLKKKKQIKPNSPPAFILDAHRGLSYTPDDFPIGVELSSLTKEVIYINESDKNGLVPQVDISSPEDSTPKDLKETFESWKKAGIKIRYTGIKPKTWEEVGF